MSVMKNCESPVSSPAIGHRQKAGTVECQKTVELVGNRRSRAAGAVAVRVAALGHEPVEDAVEGQAVVEALVDEREDPRGGNRGEAVEEPEGQVAGEGRRRLESLPVTLSLIVVPPETTSTCTRGSVLVAV